MKVALVHDWLNGMRGGERVLEALCELFPEAEIFTLLLEREKISPRIREMKIHTSFIQNLPFARKHYRNYLPFFPRAIERFDLTGYDLVISTSHAVAKGCRAPENAVNVCYCFTPMRYIWFLYEEYFGDNFLKKLVLGPSFAYLRRWDIRSSRRVGYFLAISKTVADRIARIYNREAEVIYPPVDTDFFHPAESSGDFFLIVSALVPYKRVDRAITAFNRLGLPLKIVGTGPSAARLKEKAGPQIRFLGRQGDDNLRRLYQDCRALIFPGLEDFGIVPLEAQACGRPVIGLGAGGLAETIIPWRSAGGRAPTGILFAKQTVESLIGGINLFLENETCFDRDAIRVHALQFDRKIFKEKFRKKIEEIFERIKL
ncbi:MAG: glycosyltransferase [Candidatus Euphemobacter frigidus]|nr:glycosyltransferase [Candidatus Euphemobacter frigidus]MDP8276151.1 glycosyltransferase [Candidatus Euphemobacter frigidus]